ncbi:TIGR03620 family F420-dependent LLM class oxidoreductase [Streptomyces griseocarneus]|uniref:TIGR03620 family F420-dependent LLM class oxidoreductase n=1 Tax=Streptomyces griseocarneus TaxID=51201 RepID=UPI00167D1D28|nr:TIGR03620 family F420-dependent LLM class oxidoreductase [Streptomyces griseocarneus]MBZ6473114.1 TIGR03620 family F420-dependent LLM class oxidoreductase [Streptomyces griseocarneus]GHG59941.1 LLM class F420-dependent oxidoreductase [Streptomyces griseocarneus]
MDLTSDLGTFGIWSAGLHSDDPNRLGEIREAAAELEELGFAALWIGGSPGFEGAAHVLGATRRVAVGTSILSIWEHEAADVAARYAALPPGARERLVLGLGVSHTALTPRYSRPYSAMRDYLTALDDAPVPVPAEQRVLAALGPKMAGLARDRSAGAIPYLVTTDHTARTRELLGEDAFLAPEVNVVLDTDLGRARETARSFLARYLALPNYTNNLLRLGFTEDDFKDDGSDRLVDALFALGDEQRVRDRLDEYVAAGADHLALQVVLPQRKERLRDLSRPQWRELAQILPL